MTNASESMQLGTKDRRIDVWGKAIVGFINADAITRLGGIA